MNNAHQTKQVLFLCTGNFYRSRFAEEFFNYLAHKANLPWQADSAGLAPGFGVNSNNIGPISNFTLTRLEAKGITLPRPIRFPKPAGLAELAKSDRIIALNEIEHRARFEYLFPDWVQRVEYWQIADIDVTTPSRALAQIEESVTKLFETLAKDTKD